MWYINYISYLSNFCNNLKQAKKALVEFDDTINKLNAGLTEGLILNKYKSSDEDIDARKKKGTLSEETRERSGDLQRWEALSRKRLLTTAVYHALLFHSFPIPLIERLSLTRYR